MSHTHTFADGGRAVVAGCGCVLLADPTGRIVGTLDKCIAHGGDRQPGTCRACERAAVPLATEAK